MGDGRSRVDRGMRDTLVTALRSASKPKVDETLRPTLNRLFHLRHCLDNFETALHEETEGAVINDALRVLGQPSLALNLNVPEERRQLRTALADLLSFFGEDTVAPESCPEPVVPEPVAVEKPPPPEPEPPLPRTTVAAVVVSQPKPKKPVPEPSALDIERSWKLIREVDALAKADLSTEHQIRLQHLFQAITAECRMLMERIPSSHLLYDTLGDRVIRAITRLKTECGVQPFIKGLAFASQKSNDNWYHIAHESRKKVAKFDRDAGESPGGNSTPKLGPASKSKPELPKPSYTWPELHYLRLCMKDTGWPLLIVGGSYRDQPKLDTIKERFGIECEWVEFSSDNARVWDSVADRIVAGKLSGAMLLEGFMSHKAYRRIMKAAFQNPAVPIVMAGKGGVAAIEEALKEVERQIGIAFCKIPMVKV